MNDGFKLRIIVQDGDINIFLDMPIPGYGVEGENLMKIHHPKFSTLMRKLGL